MGATGVKSSNSRRSSSLGFSAVDLIDVDERAVALAATRLARRPGDLVAGAQLAAADLRSGDVDVAVGGLEAGEAEEAVTLGQHVEDAGDGLRVDGIGLLVDLTVAFAFAVAPG